MLLTTELGREDLPQNKITNVKICGLGLRFFAVGEEEDVNEGEDMVIPTTNCNRNDAGPVLGFGKYDTSSMRASAVETLLGIVV